MVALDADFFSETNFIRRGRDSSCAAIHSTLMGSQARRAGLVFSEADGLPGLTVDRL